MSKSITVDGQHHNFLGPTSRSRVPERSGVYMVMGRGGMVVYVGESANMRQRLDGHERERSWRYWGAAS